MSCCGNSSINSFVRSSVDQLSSGYICTLKCGYTTGICPQNANSDMQVIQTASRRSRSHKCYTYHRHSGASSRKPFSTSSANTGYERQRSPVLFSLFLASRLARTCVRKASVLGSLGVRRSSHGTLDALAILGVGAVVVEEVVAEALVFRSTVHILFLADSLNLLKGSSTLVSSFSSFSSLCSI